MCSKSSLGNVNPLSNNADGGSAMALSPVSAALVKANPDKYILLNVLEADEAFEGDAQLPAGTAKMSLGKLLNLAYDNKIETAEWFKTDKTIVTICNIGKRAQVAARELVSNGYKATYITRGMFEWTSAAATKPELVVTLLTDKPDQVSLALIAAKNNQEGGSQSIIVCMGDGIKPFRNAKVTECDVKDTVEGMKAADPFPAAAGVWKAYNDLGGLTMLCTTCVKSHGLEAKDFVEGAKLFGMPDYIRMQKETLASMTYA